LAYFKKREGGENMIDFGHPFFLKHPLKSVRSGEFMGNFGRASFSQNFLLVYASKQGWISESKSSPIQLTMKETSTMKKTVLSLTCAVISLITVSSASAAITSALLSFDDHSGTPNAITSNVGTFNFSVDVSLSFTTDGNSPNQLQGLSYWLETETGAASHITLTSLTYFTITQSTDPGGNKVFNASSGADSGFLASHDSQNNPNTGTMDTGDLGGTFPAQSAGTFQVATLNFSVSGLAPGTYHLETTHLGGLTSEATNNDANPANRDTLLPQAIYTITVVPEPATLSLLGLSGLGSLGMTMLRRRRRS
jgi:hypothetical protein